VLLTKYDQSCPEETLELNHRRLINQIWKLIPMREHNEDWDKQLNTVINEISGLNQIFLTLNYLIVLSKLEGLKINKDYDFQFFRKTIFEVLQLFK